MLSALRKFQRRNSGHLRLSQRYRCTDPAITSTNPQSAPISGLVSSVKAMTVAAAAATIKTHLKTAPSLILMSGILIPRTAAKTKQVVGRRE